MEVNDGYYISPTPPWVYLDGHRGVVSLMRWYRTDTEWWAWVRWVEPLIENGVSQGGMHVQVCVPATSLRPSPKITRREYDRVHREDPVCPKCGHFGANTSYLSHGYCAHESNLILGVEPNERLHRSCGRCDYAWDEAVIAPVTVT